MTRRAAATRRSSVPGIATALGVIAGLGLGQAWAGPQVPERTGDTEQRQQRGGGEQQRGGGEQQRGGGDVDQQRGGGDVDQQRGGDVDQQRGGGDVDQQRGGDVDQQRGGDMDQQRSGDEDIYPDEPMDEVGDAAEQRTIGDTDTGDSVEQRAGEYDDVPTDDAQRGATPTQIAPEPSTPEPGVPDLRTPETRPDVITYPGGGARSYLIGAGAGILGGFYAASALTAGLLEWNQGSFERRGCLDPCAHDHGKKDKYGRRDRYDRQDNGHMTMLIPVAGPFIAMGTAEDVSGPKAAGFAALGIGQVVGLGLLVGGLATPSARRAPAADTARVQVTPTLSPTRVGLSISGRM